jgi:hypothetical protein
MEINEKLKKLLFSEITSEYKEKIIVPYESDLWILDIDKKNWYFQLESNGTLWYNQKSIDNIFKYFSIHYKNYQPIIKNWIEDLTELHVLKIARRNTNYDYILEKIEKNTKNKVTWSLSDRRGFPHHVVKKYLGISENGNFVKVDDFMIF